MQKDLRSYVKVYNTWLGKETCDTTIKELQHSEWQQHLFYNNLTKEFNPQNGDKELDITFSHCSTEKKIMDKFWLGYKQYLTDLNFSWFSTWAGFSRVRFNRYSEDKLMAEHCDHIHSLFEGENKGVPTMSALIVLNEDYEGGEFVMFQDETISLKTGDLIIFPSNFLYPHRVEPVTSGTRYSCVAWAW